jgi:hypothetical protein
MESCVTSRAVPVQSTEAQLSVSSGHRLVASTLELRNRIAEEEGGGEPQDEVAGTHMCGQYGHYARDCLN